MNLSTISFPRQLEADGSAEIIRRKLLSQTTKLQAGGKIDVPVIAMNEPLKAALWKARLQGRIRLGYAEIFEKLAGEKRGIDSVREQSAAPYGNRISRLLLFSNDGAEHFNRNIEETLLAHAPRLLGCMLDINGNALGQFITGKSGIIKIIMVEHKDAVSDVLKALMKENGGTGK
jgi:hypothetical protein